MKILIIGGTGYIGRHLTELLLSSGHQVAVSSRNPRKVMAPPAEGYSVVRWDGKSPAQLVPHLENADAVVNLAGQNIGAIRRWTTEWKRTLLSSRVVPGEALASAIMQCHNKPAILIQASAIGIYGTQAIHPAGEERPAGKGTLAEIVQQWEASVASLEDTPVRVVCIRTGIVLGKKSAFLSNIQIPFRFGMGVVLGNGRQCISWIHLQDEIEAIRFLIENPKASGPFNLSAPEPVTMSRMVKTIGRIRKLPVWLNIPSFFLRMALGELATETILASQDALPEALLDAGYSFRFGNIDDALADLLSDA